MSVGEVVGEVVEGEAIEDGVVEGEIVEGELIEDSTAQVPGGEAAPDEEVSGEPNQEKE
jgi:hypothetical protein